MSSSNPCSRSGAARGTGTRNGQQGPGAEPGHPVQLVSLDKEGGLTLDEKALSRCLEQAGVGDAPVCLVSIIGEQRRGKSFLMNCLLRRLQSPEAADASWMGREDQALRGFKCCSGTATVTKGVWMWDQPLWVQTEGRRVAVFLVDTEGSLDLQRRMETSIRLSVFSILLSSYWIFNISSTFSRLETDYLEMFIHVAREVGETCNLLPFQRLDLLVRDWQLTGAYGAGGGQEYLGEITRDLKASAEQPLVLGALRVSGIRCYLLPHPGTRFTKSRAGMLSDLDEDFRHYLWDYVTSVVRSAGTHVCTDRARQVLTGAQLAARIKGVSRYLKTKRYDFSSPMKMAETFAVMRGELNQTAINTTRSQFERFVEDKDRDHRSMISCLRVKPEKMQGHLEEKRQELLERCRGELRGEAPQKQAAQKELEEKLNKQQAQFLLTYEKRFKVKKAVSMGLCIGGTTLAVVGAGVGAGIGLGVAAAVAAVEEAVAIGVGAGSVGLFGGGVGSTVGAWMGAKMARKKKSTNTAGQENEGEGGAGCSDKEPLLPGRGHSTLGKTLSQTSALGPSVSKEIR